MSSYVDSNRKSYLTEGAIPIYSRVKRAAGGKVTLAGAGATDLAIGVIVGKDVSATEGGAVTVHLFNGPGSIFMVAAGIIAENAPVYGAASGKVSATESGAIVGWAENAAGADGDVIEVLLKGGIA